MPIDFPTNDINTPLLVSYTGINVYIPFAYFDFYEATRLERSSQLSAITSD
jgi:hypothetical protein